MQLNPWFQSLAMLTSSLLTNATALAQSSPVEGAIGVKWMNYQETQGPHDRIRVQARSSFVTLPLPHQLALEATQTVDAISGASPAYYTEPRTLTAVKDTRKAHEVGLAWYDDLQKWRLSQTHSQENDYRSRGGTLSYSHASPDRNRTIELAISRNQDSINPVNQLVTNEHKTTRDILLSTTLVITPYDLLQISWTHSTAKGYLSDPYKFFDVRPNQRQSNALSARWNHYFVDNGSTLRLSTRLHKDTFAVRSLMLQSEYSLPVSNDTLNGWVVTPLLRYYSQTQAHFFSPPDPERPSLPQIPTDTLLGITPLSFDQRLAAFGAITAGIKIEKRLNTQTTIDLRFDQYEQRNRWSSLQRGTKGLANFQAQIIQIGIRHKF